MALRRAADLSDLPSLSALEHPLRARLYEIVSEADLPVGRDEAAAAVGVSRSLAAYHLDELSRQGLLEASFARRDRTGPGAGRPAKLYRRARREFVVRTPPRDYQLLGELLVDAAEHDATGAVRETLERVAYEYGRAIGASARQDGPAGQDGLERTLRARGYEPSEYEQGAFRLRNCPFETVAGKCPEVVCRLNLRLLEGMLDGLDLDSTRALLEPTGEHCCVLITGPPVTHYWRRPAGEHTNRVPDRLED
jgi:predicted ArsR family transcriptional regulator